MTVAERQDSAEYQITAKTPQGAANQLLRAIQKMPGGERAYVHIDESPYGNAPTVCWEEGPYEWTIVATGLGDIWAEEMGGNLTDAYQRNAATFGLHGQPQWFAEPVNGYTLSFYKL
jgi:hypothetical protein